MSRITIILLSVTIGLILYFWIDNEILKNKLERAEEKVEILEVYTKDTKSYRDEAGYWRAKAQAAEVGSKSLKEDPATKEILKEFPSVKKSLKNLEAIVITQSETISRLKGRVIDTIYIDTTSQDTLQVKKISASNEWNDYDITVIGDSADIKRKGREEFDIVGYKERLTKKGKKTIWPFGKKSLTVEGVSKNPETKISKLNFILVKSRKH